MMWVHINTPPWVILMIAITIMGSVMIQTKDTPPPVVSPNPPCPLITIAPAPINRHICLESNPVITGIMAMSTSPTTPTPTTVTPSLPSKVGDDDDIDDDDDDDDDNDDDDDDDDDIDDDNDNDDNDDDNDDMVS